MSLSIIVAMAKDRVIGAKNDLPWHLPEDLKYFKATTLGKPIVMGRKTFDSIGRPLPGRQNIVVTRNAEWTHDGVDVAPSLDAAIAMAGDVPEVMITGGAQIFEMALPTVNKLYITEIELEVAGDTFFPEFSKAEWQEVSRESYPADEGKPAYAFVVYERR